MRFLLLNIAVFLLFCIPLAAASTLETNLLAYSGDSVVLDNKAYIFMVTNLGEKIVINYDDLYAETVNNSCVNIRNYRFCHNGTEYDSIKKSWRVDLNIYSLKPELEITRTIDSSSLRINEEAIVTVTIENLGSETADNVSFTDDFPAGIDITSISGCTKAGSSAIWNGKINEGKTKECTYTIIPRKEIEQTLKAKTTYTDGYTNFEAYSPAITISVQPFATIDMTLLNSSIFLGDETTLNVNISNDGEDGIDIKQLSITVPEAFTVESYKTSLSKSGSTYAWSGSLDGNDSIRLSLVITGIKTGTHEILVNMEYNDNDGITRQIRNQGASLEVKEKGIILSTSIQANELVEIDQPKRIVVYLQNTNENTDFVNATIDIGSDFGFRQTITKSLVEKENFLRIADFIVTAPKVNTTTTYHVVVNCSYKSEYGEAFAENIQDSFRVTPVAAIAVLQSADLTSVEEGNDIQVTVRIQNNRQVTLPVIAVSDKVPNAFTISGITSRSISAAAGQTATAYSYTLKTPDVKKSTSYLINTTANYTFNNISYQYFKSLKLTVNPKTIPISVAKEKTDSEIFRGEMVKISYTLRNTGDEPVYNLTFIFPVQQEFDYLNPAPYFVPKLDPGEETAIEALETVRAKYNKTLYLNSTLIYYRDQDGNLFNKSSNGISCPVYYNTIDGPAIILNKTAIVRNHTISVSIAANNVGSKPSNITLADGSRNWAISLQAGQSSRREYSYETNEAGNFQLPAASAVYTYLGSDYYAYSARPSVEIIVPSAATQTPDEVITVPRSNVSNQTSEKVAASRQWGNRNLMLAAAIFLLIIAVILMLTFRKSKKQSFKFAEEDDEFLKKGS